MPDDQVIALLTEIRDLLKQNSESIKVSQQNQEQAIEFQGQHASEVKKMIATRQKMIFITLAVVVVVTFIIMTWTSAIVK